MSIEKIRATADLRIDERAYAGCPLYLRDGSLDFVPSRWVTHMWRGEKPDTANSYARQFLPFLQYLERRRLPWWDVTTEDVDAYMTRMQLARYSPSSMRLTLQAIFSFYDWCKKRGFIERAPFIIRTGRRVSDLFLPAAIKPAGQVDRIAKIISREHFESVLEHIPAASDEVVFRTELTFQCGRYIGLRRQEIAGLTRSAIHAASGKRLPVVLLHLPASITKAGRERDVFIPQHLLHRIERYVSVYRADTVRRARERSRHYQEPQHLFLTLNGAPLSREYISATWNVAAHAAGVDARFHSNRHWFGTIVVAAAKRLKLADPLREAANLLGHADVATTQIYDHSSSLLEPDEDFTSVIELAWRRYETQQS